MDDLTPPDLTGPLMQGGRASAQSCCRFFAGCASRHRRPTGYQSDHLLENWMLARGRHVPGMTPVSPNQKPRVLRSRAGLSPAGREN